MPPVLQNTHKRPNAIGYENPDQKAPAEDPYAITVTHNKIAASDRPVKIGSAGLAVRHFGSLCCNRTSLPGSKGLLFLLLVFFAPILPHDCKRSTRNAQHLNRGRIALARMPYLNCLGKLHVWVAGLWAACSHLFAWHASGGRESRWFSPMYRRAPLKPRTATVTYHRHPGKPDQIGGPSAAAARNGIVALLRPWASGTHQSESARSSRATPHSVGYKRPMFTEAAFAGSTSRPANGRSSKPSKRSNRRPIARPPRPAMIWD